MKKDIIYVEAKRKFSGELLDIVLKQIDNYFLAENKKNNKRKIYNIGDEVILTKNHLLHGLGNKYSNVEKISERGIVSRSYFSKNLDYAFCYGTTYWTVSKKIKLEDYIINYSGIVAKYNDKYEQVPYKKLDDFVEKMKKKDTISWSATSPMEVRFMPSLAKDKNQLAFILNINDPLGKNLRKNSVFKDSFKTKYALEFTQGPARQHFEKKGFTDDFFERSDYIIFGYPKRYIEGLLVGRKYEKNNKKLKELKELFPDCYICNLDGKVIY